MCITCKHYFFPWATKAISMFGARSFLIPSLSLHNNHGRSFTLFSRNLYCSVCLHACAAANAKLEEVSTACAEANRQLQEAAAAPAVPPAAESAEQLQELQDQVDGLQASLYPSYFTLPFSLCVCVCVCAQVRVRARRNVCSQYLSKLAKQKWVSSGTVA